MGKDRAIMPGAISLPVKINGIPEAVIGLVGRPVTGVVKEERELVSRY
jgi:hypothetical protein